MWFQVAGAEQGGGSAEVQHDAEEGRPGADAQSEEEPPLTHQGKGAAQDGAHGGEESRVSCWRVYLCWSLCTLYLLVCQVTPQAILVSGVVSLVIHATSVKFC